MKKYFLTLLSVAVAALPAAADSIPRDLLPTVGGAVRARWEMQTRGRGLNRFTVRNARVTVGGKLGAPVEYFLQADLCNQGKMQFLDGWVRLNILPKLYVQGGQFRMPFGVDAFRGPGNYIFANRSFIGRDMCNVRAVGLKAAWTVPGTRLGLEAGVFSPGIMETHSEWGHDKAAAGKATFGLGDFKISAGAATIIPDSLRMNLVDAAVVYSSDRWEASAEYMYEHYTGHAARDCHGAVCWADYKMPVRAGIFNRFSAQGRFEFITSHCTGLHTDGKLNASQPARRRITVGATLTRLMGSRHADIRINYEKYFYNHGVTPLANRDDMIVAELVVKF